MANIEGGKMNVKNIVITVLLSIGVVALMSVLLFRTSGQQVETNAVYEGVAGEERHVRGEGEIAIVEFSDFQCPACRASQEPLNDILERYEGRVRLIYRHLPLTTIHPNAQAAAEAAEAAHLQGKFFEYHDRLFETQSEWSAESNPADLFVSYAGDIGLDVQQFRNDLEREEIRSVVSRDNLEATRLGLSSTPSFFVEGQRVDLGNMETVIATFLNPGE